MLMIIFVGVLFLFEELFLLDGMLIVLDGRCYKK